MIISFAHTTPALLAGRKTVTRRDWNPDHAAKFGAGMFIDAYDRSPRVHGHRVAKLRITHAPVRENTRVMSDSEYEAEGFAYLDAHRVPVVVSALFEKGAFLTWREAFEFWRMRAVDHWVVRFELVEVVR